MGRCTLTFLSLILWALLQLTGCQSTSSERLPPPVVDPKTFCTTAFGFKQGQMGQSLLNQSLLKSCSLKQKKEFESGYYKGRVLFLKNEIKELKTLHASAQDRLWLKTQEHETLQNENPEEAKLLKDMVDAYQEETLTLREQIEKTQLELATTKRHSAEFSF